MLSWMAAEEVWPPGGWYPDPTGRFPRRLWDGHEWAADVVGESGIEIVDQLFVRASHLDAEVRAPQTLAHASSIAMPETGGARATRYTSLVPDLAARQLANSLQLLGTIELTSVDASTVEGVVRTKGQVNWIIAVVLICIYLVPGIVYIVWAQREKRDAFRLILSPEVGGTRVTLQCAPSTHAVLARALASLPA
jgi:hypothetical protein